jgi:PAS domain S-box-containing protein
VLITVLVWRRHRTQLLRQAKEEWERTFNSVPDMITVLDCQNRIVRVNRAMAERLKVSPEQCAGLACFESVHGLPEPPSHCPHVRTMRDQQEYSTEIHEQRLGGDFLVTTTPLRNERGDMIGAVHVARDITQRKRAEEAMQASLREKEVLLKEIHHRVKNNLQVVSSLVSLQSDNLTDAAMQEQFREVRHRIRAMALVHEKLYQSIDLARVDFGDYARELIGYLIRFHRTAVDVNWQIIADSVHLDIEKATPCGLILNELTTNALKHAFNGHPRGEITLELRCNGSGDMELKFSDNGIGLPAGLDWRNTRSLGLRLVQLLTYQLNGKIEVRGGPGTTFHLSFPIAQARETETKHEPEQTTV